MARSVSSLSDWKDNRDTGHAGLDSQHKELLKIANALHKAFRAGRGDHELKKIFQQLIESSRTHFTEEEQSMQACDYPEYAQHKAEHDALYQQVLDLQRRLREGKEVFSIDVIYFLRHWVMRHIVEADRRYGSFLKAKGREPDAKSR